MFPGPGNGVCCARLGSQLPVCNRAFRAPGLAREHGDAQRRRAQRAKDQARIRCFQRAVCVRSEAQRALCPALQREPPEGAAGEGRGRRDWWLPRGCSRLATVARPPPFAGHKHPGPSLHNDRYVKAGAPRASARAYDPLHAA